MAMVKSTIEYVEREGKQGGNVYRSDQCGQHIQATPRLVEKEPTKKQRIRRNGFSYLLKRYIHFLTPEQRGSWVIYSLHHPKKTKKGKIYSLPPQLMYLSYNINRYVSGLPVVDDAPN